MKQHKNSSISFVLPCLNEEQSLPILLDRVNEIRAREFKERETEVILADNGSSDKSVKIAEARGATVVHNAVIGYGATLQAGIAASKFEIIVIADADNTYDFRETPRLIEELERGFDLVVGSRMKGEIHPGAMPFLHRYVGTPALTILINTLHGGSKNVISDCNSGFRCFRRKTYFSWEVRSTGMEFASEMLIQAMNSRSRISEVPISLYPDTGPREPHLRTWRDGMRHLLQILRQSPRFFCFSGLSIAIASWMIMFVGLFVGQLRIGSAVVFGLHSMMLALLGTLLGLTLWSIGLYLVAQKEPILPMYRFLMNLPEERLFWSIVALATLGAVAFAWIFVEWVGNDYNFLALEKELLVLVAVGSNATLLVMNIFTAHMIKRG